MNYSAKRREKSFAFSERFRRKGEVCEDADGMRKRCQQKFSMGGKMEGVGRKRYL